MKRFILAAVVLVSCNKLCAQHSPVNTVAKSDAVIATDTVPQYLPIIKDISYDGLDGPYIVDDTLYRVDSKSRLVMNTHYNHDSLLVRANNTYGDYFHLALESKYVVPETSYVQPEKIIVISDIEGKFSAFASFLIANKVIDENFNWIFNEGHLVLTGDFVDRGKNVTSVLWLIYKLEFQARTAGGQVHYILGNHEVLNFRGDHRYNNGKYIKVAQEISGEENQMKAIKFIYSNHTEIGTWLATKNVIEKIGDYLFVHAGLSPEILLFELSLEEINERVRARLNLEGGKSDKVDEFLYGARGPFWYRGLVMDKVIYKKIKAVDLDRILAYYGAKKIVIGHTLVNDISTSYRGKVIMTDVGHGTAKFTGNTKGVLIEGKQEYAIDDLGKRTTLR